MVQPDHSENLTTAQGRLVADPTVLLTVAPEQTAEAMAFPVSRAKLVALSDQGMQCTPLPDSGPKQ